MTVAEGAEKSLWYKFQVTEQDPVPAPAAGDFAIRSGATVREATSTPQPVATPAPQETPPVPQPDAHPDDKAPPN